MVRTSKARLFGVHWRSLAAALLGVFLIRALIPVGYMPSQGLSPVGALAITLCVKGMPASIAKTLGLDVSTSDFEPQTIECVFGSQAGQSVLLLTAAVVLVAIGLAAGLAYAPGHESKRRAPVRGPPVGSRAPPAFRSY